MTLESLQGLHRAMMPLRVCASKAPKGTSCANEVLQVGIYLAPVNLLLQPNAKNQPIARGHGGKTQYCIQAKQGSQQQMAVEVGVLCTGRYQWTTLDTNDMHDCLS